ncbi:flavodoxin family protein [Candidatus Fermentibacteria bacterium]|nr:flavodoxin family protein [Candidatus Fermentibacteria bacterium]
MKVLAVQGSPHQGNTHHRVERLGEILVGLGDMEFEHIALKDVNLKGCLGCFRCFAHGEDSCPLNDDRAMIADKMDEADALVFATPVYSMQVSYLLKRFVDRFAYNFHRPRFFDKYAVGLAVAGAVGLKDTLRYIETFSELWGFEYAAGLKYVDPPRESNIPRLIKPKDRTERVARKLHRLLKLNPPRRLSFRDHLTFHTQRTAYARMEAYSPADYAYWKTKGWLDPDCRYFTDHARVGLVKNLVARLVAGAMGKVMDRRLSNDRD